LGLGIGMMIGLVGFGLASDKIVKKLSINGITKREYRLPPMIPASVMVPAGLFIYGWTAKYQIQWIVPILGTAFVGRGLIGSFVSPTLFLFPIRSDLL
jgi:hypothetical protein